MFVHNLATQASLLQQKHYNSAHEIHFGTAFILRILYCYCCNQLACAAKLCKHNWESS